MDEFALTPAQMKYIENAACESGLFSLNMFSLMRNAGIKLAKILLSLKKKHYTFLCGNGNNGGDGFVAAYILQKNGKDVTLVMPCSIPKTDISKYAFDNLIKNCLGKNSIKIVTSLPPKSEVIVDCLFGTGFHGEFRDEKIINILKNANKSNSIKVTCDIPSGANALSGTACENAFKADITVTFSEYKTGQFFEPLKTLCGKILKVDIGITEEITENLSEKALILSKKSVSALIPKRKTNAHKGTFGALLNISGSDNFIGAAALSTLAALRCGAGLVTLASTKNVISSVSSSIYESTFLHLKGSKKADTEIISNNLEKKSAVLLGCGRGNDEITFELCSKLLENASCPIILDADGINCLSGRIDILRKTKSEVILTPHLGEFSKICEQSIESIVENKFEISKEFCQKYGVNLVLKGAGTLITTKKGQQFISPVGNNGLSRGGSGDVLAGMIASFVAQFFAQGLEIEKAVCLAVFLHGFTADELALKISKQCMLPSDLINELPLLLKKIDR